MPRFVVLRHDIGPNLTRTGDTHLDWMFECDGRLRTYATDVIEIHSSEFTVPAQSLADHRIEYLHFEGAISGDRGRVVRMAHGDFEVVESTPKRWHITLHWVINSPETGESVVPGHRVISELCVEAVREGLQFRLSATR